MVLGARPSARAIARALSWLHFIPMITPRSSALI